MTTKAFLLIFCFGLIQGYNHRYAHSKKDDHAPHSIPSNRRQLIYYPQKHYYYHTNNQPSIQPRHDRSSYSNEPLQKPQHPPKPTYYEVSQGHYHSHSPSRICFLTHAKSYIRTPKEKKPKGLSSQMNKVRRNLMALLSEQSSAIEATSAISNLYSRAVSTMANFMNDASNQMELSGETGRMFTETTESFAQLLYTIDKFFQPRYPKFDADLEKSKLRLVEETRLTLSGFLNDLNSINELPDEEKTEEYLYGQELLIEHTKNSYKIVYETTNSMLVNILKSPFGKSPIKKILATRILNSAVKHIKAFSYVRTQISSVILTGDIKDDHLKDPNLVKLQNEIKHQMTDSHAKDEKHNNDKHVKVIENHKDMKNDLKSDEKKIVDNKPKLNEKKDKDHDELKKDENNKEPNKENENVEEKDKKVEKDM